MPAGERLLNHPIIDCIVGTGTFVGKGQGILEFTGTFVTGNTFDLTINGVAIVQVPFTTDHDTTMRAIATSINNHAAVAAFAVRATTIDRILIEASTNGVNLTFSGLTIAGGATRPYAVFSPGNSGSYQEQPALLVWEPAGSGDATAANQLLILAQLTSKINRIKGAANYSQTITYAAAQGSPGGENPTVIVHSGTTVIGVETITETITYPTPLVDNSRVSSIVYS